MRGSKFFCEYEAAFLSQMHNRMEVLQRDRLHWRYTSYILTGVILILILGMLFSGNCR